ncbi:MAG: hypothetical protein QCI82_05230 [Candidatus Thermoplasmatota archaeon]|nr:hypothetical protein [Candidatus Thermoplasmatota archaeon]
MSRKGLWSWIAVAGLVLLIIGSFLLFIPYLGLVTLGLGTILMFIGIIALIPILIREMKKDDAEMREAISERELRP